MLDVIKVIFKINVITNFLLNFLHYFQNIKIVIRFNKKMLQEPIIILIATK